MRKSIIFILLFCWGCSENEENAPLIHDDLYYECLSDPFCQYNWQLAEMKVLSGDTLVFQFEPKRLYFDLVNQGAISDKKQFAAYLKKCISERDTTLIKGNYNVIRFGYYSEFALLSIVDISDRYIDKDGYVNTGSIPDEKLPSFLLRLKDFNILVDQEDYSGRLKIYSPSEALKGLRECKTNLPQSN